MKNDLEMFNSVLSRLELYEKQKKRKSIIVRRTAALGVGAAAIVGIGICANALKPPKKPTPSQSGIIVETETTSAETTAAQTSLSTSFQKTTATKQMTSTNQVTTTAVSTATPTSSARQTRTTVRTIVTADCTTKTTVSTNTEPISVTTVTTSTISTTQVTEQETPEIILETTAATDILEMPETLTTTNNENKSYDEMLALNFMVIRLSENKLLVSGVVEADFDSLGEQVNEITLRPTCYTDFLPEELTAQIYNIKGNNLKKQVAVRFTGSEKFIIYNIVKA
ncbi:MAG: hypothetical protein MJ079_04425 [Ruminococcus sp.]|nr:hypothetical protein [Ruminococcus sp.]